MLVCKKLSRLSGRLLLNHTLVSCLSVPWECYRIGDIKASINFIIKPLLHTLHEAWLLHHGEQQMVAFRTNAKNILLY